MVHRPDNDDDDDDEEMDYQNGGNMEEGEEPVTPSGIIYRSKTRLTLKTIIT